MILDLKNWASELMKRPDEETKMPVLFIGHGHPKNSLEMNDFTQALKSLGEKIIKPKAIIMVSAHWCTNGTFVNGSTQPKMIYDYSGFPEEYYRIQYPAKGNPELARDLQQLITTTPVLWDTNWGFDHGGYIVLRNMYPLADIPTFQLSIDYHKSFSFHYELAKELKSLRNKGVLIIGSGNITHNFREINWDINAKPADWAFDFDNQITNYLEIYNHQAIVNIQSNNLYIRAHPEPSHYLPILYCIGLSDKKDIISYPHMSWSFGNGSMRCVMFS